MGGEFVQRITIIFMGTYQVYSYFLFDNAPDTGAFNTIRDASKGADAGTSIKQSY